MERISGFNDYPAPDELLAARSLRILKTRGMPPANAIQDFSLSHNTNFSLSFTAKLKSSDIAKFRDLSAGLYDSRPKSILAQVRSGTAWILISGIYITEIGGEYLLHRENPDFVFSGIISRIITRTRPFPAIGTSSPRTWTFWYLNHDPRFPTDRMENISEERHITIAEDLDGPTRFAVRRHAWRGSKNHIRVRFNPETEFLLGHTDSANKQQRLLWIRFERVHTRPSNVLIEAAAAIYMFLTGIEIIPIGNATLDESLLIFRRTQNSTHRDDLDRVFNQYAEHPIPISRQIIDRSKIDIEAVFANLLQAYLDYSGGRALDKAMWYMISSRYVPLDMTIQPLATAFDLLCKAYFKGNQPTHISKPVFKRATQKAFAEIQRRITIDEGPTIALEIKRNLERANTISQNKKNWKFLSELGLEHGKIEENALQKYRNRAVHGSPDPHEAEGLIQSAHDFRTLLNRVILRLLKYEGKYVDYSCKWGKFYRCPYLNERQGHPTRS